MLARLGNVLYWFGLIVAVPAISGAIILNGWTFYEWQKAKQIQDNVIAKYNASMGCIPPPPPGFQVDTPLKEGQRLCDAEDAPGNPFAPKPEGNRPVSGPWEEYQKQELLRHSEVLRRADNRREFSLVVGGIMGVGGLFAFGFGWAARYVLRGAAPHD